MILNLTQHHATPEQIAQGVVDLPAGHHVLLAQSLTVDALPTRQEITDRCANIAALAVHNGLGGDDADDPHPTAAMIGGAPWMMAELERALLDMGVPAVYAFSVREDGDSRMPYAAWQWFTLRTNQNPDWFVVSRKALIGPTL